METNQYFEDSKVIFNDIIQELGNIQIDNIKKFTFSGISTYAKIIKVYDGDTATIIFKHNNEYIKLNCRINGIDAPEIKSKILNEKNMANHAKLFLQNIILNQIVFIKFYDFDKYGRPLVDIIINYNNNYKTISNIMISGGFARKYDGGHKDEWITNFNL
jgi:micrococcal nuclease